VRIGTVLVNCLNRVFLFGGYNKTAINDLYYLDAKKAEWVDMKGIKSKRPTERYGHSALLYKG
jgi:N-acetylneuraminic acid mutarotase